MICGLTIQSFYKYIELTINEIKFHANYLLHASGDLFSFKHDDILYQSVKYRQNLKIIINVSYWLENAQFDSAIGKTFYSFYC